jgi:hypothetical protein
MVRESKKGYMNAMVYMIRHKEREETVYVGSTVDYKQRKASHRYVCKTPSHKGYHHKLYTLVREKGGWDHFEFVELEWFPCQNAQSLLEREDEWTKVYKFPPGNQIRACLSKAEKREQQLGEKNRKYARNRVQRFINTSIYRKTHRAEINAKLRAKTAARKAAKKQLEVVNV